jgi:2-keto-4-pentenoate hydratase
VDDEVRLEVMSPNLPDFKIYVLLIYFLSWEIKGNVGNYQRFDNMGFDQVENLTQELFTAYESGQRIAVLPSQRPGFDIGAAYQVEAALKRRREAQGHRSVGRKVGYANKAMLRVLKLDTLLWAHMYDDTVHYNDNNSGELALPKARSLKVEPEIVFGLQEPVGEVAAAAAALGHVDWLAIGFEVIDCPYLDWKFQPSDFLASFGLHAALVVGERIKLRPEMIASVADELGKFKVRVSKGEEFVEEGSGKNSLKSPALCLAELGAAIARRFPSELLSPGEIVSSGTLTAGHLAGPGDVWRVDVDGIALPSLRLKLS